VLSVRQAGTARGMLTCYSYLCNGCLSTEQIVMAHLEEQVNIIPCANEGSQQQKNLQASVQCVKTKVLGICCVQWVDWLRIISR
jgi:hypothetical protein